MALSVPNAPKSDTGKRTWTEEEIQRLPDNGYKHEIVDGELVMSPKNNFEHEGLFERLFGELHLFNRSRRLGALRGSNLGCWMINRNVRAPDISFIMKERLRSLGFRFNSRKFLPCAPDLAVEIVSPSNTRAEIDAWLKDFFASGTQIAWVIHPDDQFVEVCHSPTDRRIVGPGGDLEGEHLLPGFRYSTADLFADEDWS